MGKQRFIPSPNLPVLKFSNNWNKKLFCDAFTSIRLKQAKYYVGAVFKVQEGNNTVYGYYRIVAIQELRLHEIDDFIGYLDTGYSGHETQNILLNMYKNSKNIDIKTHPIYRILFLKQPI
jgi:hypothetical protein